MALNNFNAVVRATRCHESLIKAAHDIAISPFWTAGRSAIQSHTVEAPTESKWMAVKSRLF